MFIKMVSGYLLNAQPKTSQIGSFTFVQCNSIISEVCIGDVNLLLRNLNEKLMCMRERPVLSTFYP